MNLWFKQQKQLLLQDKKKLALIVGLFCVMLLLWGRLILKEVPRTAVANPAPSSAAAVSLTESTDAVKRILLSSQKPVVPVKLPDISKRDLFALDLTDYPTEAVETPKKRPVDRKPQGDKIENELKGMVGRIRLESTVLGSRPCAVINGQIVVVGQSIEGLILKEVQNRQVLLEYRGRMVRLRMN
ncbi:MAG: hypothetical protein JKX85_13060 [Phycisphaeraceae bacterium]|nr:hypothetical protein [Phycisphaeraceae bacterium]